MANSVELQEVDRGLRALVGLLNDPEVHTIAAVFRADFLAASQQVDVLSDFKDLHDLLHDLQFQCYNYIASLTARFPEDELAVDTLTDHALTFKFLVARLLEVASRPSVTGESTWIADLEEAEVLLTQALQAKDSAAFKRHCWLVRRVLDRYPSLVNARLNSAARALRIHAIEQAMTTILDMLRNRVGASAEVTSFGVGIASLAALNQRLTYLLGHHDRWQDVDVELRRLEATSGSDMEDLELSWPGITIGTMSLLCDEDESEIQALRWESAKIEEALQVNEPEKARRHVERFHRQAAERFYRVDTELKTLCGQLRTIGAPLAAVANFLAAMPTPALTPQAEIDRANVTTSAEHEDLQQEHKELTHKYDELTQQIEAIDRDFGNTLDSELRLVLQRRRADRESERANVASRLSRIEAKLDELSST